MAGMMMCLPPGRAARATKGLPKVLHGVTEPRARTCPRKPEHASGNPTIVNLRAMTVRREQATSGRAQASNERATGSNRPAGTRSAHARTDSSPARGISLPRSPGPPAMMLPGKARAGRQLAGMPPRASQRRATHLPATSPFQRNLHSQRNRGAKHPKATSRPPIVNPGSAGIPVPRPPGAKPLLVTVSPWRPRRASRRGRVLGVTSPRAVQPLPRAISATSLRHPRHRPVAVPAARRARGLTKATR